MIHELRIYTVVPGKQAEYLQRSAEVGRKIRGDKYGKLEGFWSTEFGALNQVVHLWSFADLNERERLRADLARNEEWTKGYLPQSRALIVAQENRILSPALPLKPPPDAGHVYELRMYRTQVGKAPEWLGLYKSIMPIREKYSKNVGLWQTEIGPLNEVAHLWAYQDFNDRAAVRAEAMKDPEWQAFLGKATPLLLEMKSLALNPASHSPMR